MPKARIVGSCSLAILIALYVVGAVSAVPGSLRHEVQTLPLWVPIVAGLIAANGLWRLRAGWQAVARHLLAFAMAWLLIVGPWLRRRRGAHEVPTT